MSIQPDQPTDPILEPVEVPTVSDPVLDQPVGVNGDSPGQSSGLRQAPCGRHYVAQVTDEAQPTRRARGVFIQACTLAYGHDGDHGQGEV